MNEDIAMGDFVFEKASEGDALEIIALYQDLVGLEGCNFSSEYPTLEIVKNDISKKDMHILRSGAGKIVAAAFSGIITHGGYESFFEGRLKNARDFARIGVLRSMHGKGVGRALMRSLLLDAKARGCDGAHLLVSPTNPKAIALYTKCGFERIGEVEFYDEVWISMELRF